MINVRASLTDRDRVDCHIAAPSQLREQFADGFLTVCAHTPGSLLGLRVKHPQGPGTHRGDSAAEFLALNLCLMAGNFLGAIIREVNPRFGPRFRSKLGSKLDGSVVLLGSGRVAGPRWHSRWRGRRGQLHPSPRRWRGIK